MTPLDLAFLLGPLMVPVVAPLALVPILVVRKPPWALWLGIGLFGLAGMTWLASWALWGYSFDYVDSDTQWWSSFDVFFNAVIAVCAACNLGLLATAVRVLLLALARRRNTRPAQGEIAR